MNTQEKKKAFNLKDYKAVGVIAILYVALWLYFPSIAQESGKVSTTTFKDMMLIIPGIVILMGLFEVWIPKTLIQKHMGGESGLKSFLLAFIFGTMPTGPLYVAFPIAIGLFKKGASVFSIVVFLGTWASLKLPQLMVETKFLGISFTIVRFILTMTSIVIMGLFMEKLMNREEIYSPKVEPGHSSDYNEKF